MQVRNALLFFPSSGRWTPPIFFYRCTVFSFRMNTTFHPPNCHILPDDGPFRSSGFWVEPCGRAARRVQTTPLAAGLFPTLLLLSRISFFAFDWGEAFFEPSGCTHPPTTPEIIPFFLPVHGNRHSFVCIWCSSFPSGQIASLLSPIDRLFFVTFPNRFPFATPPDFRDLATLSTKAFFRKYDRIFFNPPLFSPRNFPSHPDCRTNTSFPQGIRISRSWLPRLPPRLSDLGRRASFTSITANLCAVLAIPGGSQNLLPAAPFSP